MCFLSTFKTAFFVFVHLKLEFTIYLWDQKVGILTWIQYGGKSWYVSTYSGQITDPKAFTLIFFCLKNKTALIPSFILLLKLHTELLTRSQRIQKFT